MRNLKLLLSYDGTEFHGWQTQPGMRTVQETLETAIGEITGEPIGIPRLLARPTATVCVDVKGQNEQIESQFRDR